MNVLLLTVAGCEAPTSRPAKDGGSDGESAGTSGPDAGEAGDTGEPAKWTALSVGYYYLCALDSRGRIACTPDAPSVAGGVAPDGTYRSISSGYDHACALTDAGTVHCWGGDTYGQASAFEGTGAAEVVAMYEATCMIDLEGAVQCAGNGEWGLADAPDVAATHVAGHFFTACVLDEDGSPHCWGLDQFETFPRPEEVSGLQEIDPAIFATLLVDEDGRLRWFSGGELGSPIYRTTGWHDIANNDPGWCAIREYEVTCSSGEFPAPDDQYVAIALWHNACGLTTAGEIRCWATNAYPYVSPDNWPDLLRTAEWIDQADQKG
jgi:hypothetical protein